MYLNRIGKLLAGFLAGSALMSAQAIEAHSLQQVVQHTVKTNPEVLRSAKVKHATNEQVNQARADYYPTVDFRAGFGRERAYNNNTKAENGDALSSWRRQYGLTVRQNLFRGFQTYYEVKRTTAKTDADAYAVCATAEDIALDATEAYLNVLRFNRQLQVANRNSDAHQGIYDMIKRRGESGIGREADISQATGRLALAKSNLYNIQNESKNSQVTYSKVTGLPAFGLSMPADPANSVLPSSLDRAEYLALKYHPKMRIAVIDVEELRAQHNVSHYTAFPSLDFVIEANKDLNVGGSRGRNDSYVAGLELNYNLFNGGADVARQRETAYLTQEASELRNRTCREVKENVRLAWNNMNTARSRLTTLDTHKVSAAKTREAYDEQFRLGKRTLFDLLDAQNEAFTAELEYVNGVYDLYIAEFRVLNAIGALNSYLRVKIPEAAIAQYDIYDERANPITVGNHFDAKLWCEDKPSVWYNQEKIHHEKLSDCTNCNGYQASYTRGDRSGMKGMSGMKGYSNNDYTHHQRLANLSTENRLPARYNRYSQQSRSSFTDAQPQVQQQAQLASEDADQPRNTYSNRPLPTRLQRSAELSVAQASQLAKAQPSSQYGDEAAVVTPKQPQRKSESAAMTPDAINKQFAKTPRISEENQNQKSIDDIDVDQNQNDYVDSADNSEDRSVTVAAEREQRQLDQTGQEEAIDNQQQSLQFQQQRQLQQTNQKPQQSRAQPTLSQPVVTKHNQAFVDQPMQAYTDEAQAAQQAGSRPRVAAEPLKSKISTKVEVRADNRNSPNFARSAANTPAPKLQPQTNAITLPDDEEAATISQPSTPIKQSSLQSPKAKIATTATTRSFKPNNNGWAVQVGSFEDQEAVDEMIATLKNYGIGGYLKEIRSSTSITYEIFVGPTKSKNEAQQLVSKLRKLNIHGAIVESTSA